MDEVKLQWGYKARPTTDLKDWPSGIVRCADCNSTLVYALPRYYKCNSYAKGRCTSSQHIRADLLKEAIIERLTLDLKATSPLSANVIYKEERGENITALEARIEALERKKVRLKEAFLNGADTVEEYKRWKLAIEADITALEERLESAKSEVSPDDLMSTLKNSISEALETLTSPVSTKEQKNAAARSVIDKCTYNKASNLLSIVYRVIF